MQVKTWRRLWHLLGGSFFPVLVFFVPRPALLITLGALTAVFVSWEIIRFIFPRFNRWMVSKLGSILKMEEASGITGTTCLLIASLVVLILFDKYIAIASLFFLSIGDLTASIIGSTFGRHKIFKKVCLKS